MSAVEAFDAVDLIRAKRDGHELDTAEIDWLIDAYTRGYVADEQMSAMTMAIFLNGMSRREIRDMTMAMIASGERMDFSGLGKPTTDKHSTGGVGDKITLPLMPLVATFGVAVPQLSGPRARPHRRHARQARVDPRLARRPHERGDVRAAPRRRRRDLRRRLRARPGRQEALRAARHHGHRRGDPAHRVLDHVEEDRRGHGRARARREVRLGRVPAGHRALARARPHDGRARRGRRRGDLGAAHEHERAARPHDRQRQRGARVGRGARRRRPGRRARAHRGAGPRDARPRRACTDADVEAALDDGRAMDTWRRAIRAQGGDPDAAAARRARAARRHRRPRRRARASRRRCRSASPRGASAPAARARRTRCTTPRASTCTPSRATPCAPGQPLFTLHADEPARFARALEAVEGAYRIGDAGDADRGRRRRSSPTASVAS